MAAPNIVVSDLNPHAGEDGLFGDEEQNIIRPAIVAARKDGIDVEGPVGADTMLDRPGVDAFIVMLHDQGHIPAKLLAPRRTAGLSIGGLGRPWQRPRYRRPQPGRPGGDHRSGQAAGRMIQAGWLAGPEQSLYHPINRMYF